MAGSNEPIQSVSVSGYTRVKQPEPHVEFTIAVSLPSRTYRLQQRYSAFEALQHVLTSQCGAAPPRPLPPKHPLSRLSVLNPFGSKELPDDQLTQRQEGLSDWLRAILADRDPRWRSSRVFKDFLAAPPDDGQGATGGQAGGAGRDWTPTTWMAKRTAAEDLVRTLRAQLDKRDALLLDSSSSAHAVAREVKSGLVDAVRRLSELTRGLEALAKQGMTEGEVQRRGAMVQRLQADVEELGKKAGSGPRVGAARTMPGGYGGGGRDEPPPSATRTALLGGAGKAPTRVLGAAAAAGGSLETPETRPLDNGGIMQLQQQYMDDQDSKLEGLTAALRRQRHLGEMINQELALQEDVLNSLESGTTRVQNKMKAATKQMKKLW
ncbi:hypothetical protein JCM8097_001996 [Rhodosporidiobolus ruineniae]